MTFLERYAHCFHRGMNVIGVINHFLIGFYADNVNDTKKPRLDKKIMDSRGKINNCYFVK